MPNEELDVIEQDEEELEGQEGSTEQDEPQTTLPDHAKGEKTLNRQELIDQTMNEGAEEVVIDELASKEGDLTVEDLRKLPGSEDLTDEQIMAEWNKAVKAAGGTEGAAQAAAGSTETFKLPFPVYDANGNKIDALEKISVRDLLEGKLQIGYNALGKEQRKTLAEALRNASMGHFNEQKYNTTIQERNQVQQQAEQYRQQVEQFTNERKVWDAALNALSQGNVEPMKRLAQAYQQALTQMPAQNIPGMVSIESVRAEQEQTAAGQRFINDTILPAASDIAKRYGADLKEVQGAIEHFIKRDLHFLTREKIDQIIQYEVPQLFEANGYTASTEAAGQTNQSGQQQPTPSSEVAELKKTVEALQARVAGTRNAATEKVRNKKAPPAGGGATPGAGDSMPSFKSRSQMKAWMQGDADWQKA